MKWRTLLGGAALLGAMAASAQTLRVAHHGDVQSMDPHAVAEALQLSVLGNVYEPLVGRGRALEIVPALAERWERVSPTSWRFVLRPNVRFHDGRPLTSDDVVFSIERARSDSSGIKVLAAAIKTVRAAGAGAVEIETRTPNPILPETLTALYVMSRRWCEEHRAVSPADHRRREENAATFLANGTGPFRLKERSPGMRTVLLRHAGHWAVPEGNVQEVVVQPIVNDATRIAALLTGEVDVIDPVPPQDMERVRSHPELRLLTQPELRVMFLGMDQGREELLHSNVKGRNPLRDVRVRKAFYQAIDTQAIIDVVMRGAALPIATMVAPGVKGYPASHDPRPPHDVAAARGLLAEAGYPDGFEIGMHCSNDRYINDAQICQAVAANLARIGVRVRLQLESKLLFFARILKPEASFYLIGVTPSTYDAHVVIESVTAAPSRPGVGYFNAGRYQNPVIESLVLLIQSEPDESRRNEMIREALQRHQRDVGHIPLHQSMLVWAVRKNVELVQLADSFMPYKWITIR